MTVKLRSQSSPSGSPGSVEVRPAQVFIVDDDILQRAPGVPLSPGPVLGLDVSKAFLSAVRRQRGIRVKPGTFEHDDTLLLSLLLHAGNHVAACLADMADPDIVQFAARSRADRRIPLLLSTGEQESLSVCPLHQGEAGFFRQSAALKPVSAENYLVAVRQQASLLLDDAFLAKQGIDASRVHTRSVLLHLPPACLAMSSRQSDGASGPVHH